ncbi:M48 family metalloprotease [Nitrosospira sp. Nsp1]|uniref:M48 family metalloprotease n=1 Tax=Nitrosospira sp. Nsp1 TaxID=136547 RepID=UPI000890BC5A|nr:M48 family metalloprotease [Nitrosospira sp. Nsp1]SCX61360.1 Peptidase family M48 [Nitrosospira sp. Nsp1]
MSIPSFTKSVLLTAFLAVIPLVSIPGANAAEQTPSILKWLTEPETKEGEQGQAYDVEGDIHIKEITRLAPKASVVLDKNCPEIVQPYKLTDNFASVTAYLVKQEVQSGIQALGRGFQGLMMGQGIGSVRLDNATREIPASAKLAAKQLNWLPMNAELLYGEQLHQEETNILDRDRKLGKKYYPIADKMLREILAEIDEPHEYQFKLFILKNSGGNAVARPGGFLYLDQGLIDNPAKHPKAYFALAHEVAHVLQRHETKELQSMVIDSISDTGDLVKIMSSVRNNPSVILAHVKLEKDLFTRHHIDQELQSDSCAVKLLSRVFPEGEGLTNSIKAFLKDFPPPELDKHAPRPQTEIERAAASVHDIVNNPIKRHPNSQERTQNLNAVYVEIKQYERLKNR